MRIIDAILSEDLQQELPKRIIELRKTAGLTQAVVAERLEITKGRYNHYERGIRRFPVALIPKLIEVLGCTEVELLSNGDNMPRQKRGPLSAWEKRITAIKQLPRNRQRQISEVVDALIAKE